MRIDLFKPYGNMNHRGTLTQHPQSQLQALLSYFLITKALSFIKVWSVFDKQVQV